MKKISTLMLNGEVKDNLRLLSSKSQGSVLPLDSNVHCSLGCQHPKKQSAHLNTPINSLPGDLPHPIMFDQIDSICVHRIVLELHRAAGPSGLNTSAWKHMCASLIFNLFYVMLCHQSLKHYALSQLILQHYPLCYLSAYCFR